MRSLQFGSGLVGAGRAGLAAATLLAASCGPEGSPPESSRGSSGESRAFVGVVEGSDARIAVVERQGSLSAYVCGGPSSYEALSRWFEPSAVAGDPSRFEASKDGWTLTGALSPGEREGEQTPGAAPRRVLSGRLEGPDGKWYRFHGELAYPGSLAGLYGVVDEGCKTGAVVLQASPSEEPTVLGTWCSSAGERMQVTPVMPVELHAGALDLQVVRLGAVRHLVALPVEAERAAVGR
jgi:hypothetical protein